MSASPHNTSILHLTPGEVFASRPDCLWLIKSGVVKSYTLSEDGASITLGFWGADDLVGESLSRVKPHNYKCISKVVAIPVPSSEWQKISQNLLCQAQQTQQLIYIVRNNRIAKRLWLLLNWLGQKFGRDVGDGMLIDFKLTHQELADAISTTRITVTKTLNQFEREGLILRPKTKCIILKN